MRGSPIRLWLLILSAFVMCQAISQETPMEAFRSLSKHALRVNGLNKDTGLLAPLKLSEYSLSETLIIRAKVSDILRHLETAKLNGREKANLAWVLPLASQWQGEDYRKLCQAMLEIPSLAGEGFSSLSALQPENNHLANGIHGKCQGITSRPIG